MMSAVKPLDFKDPVQLSGTQFGPLGGTVCAYNFGALVPFHVAFVAVASEPDWEVSTANMEPSEVVANEPGDKAFFTQHGGDKYTVRSGTKVVVLDADYGFMTVDEYGKLAGNLLGLG